MILEDIYINEIQVHSQYQCDGITAGRLFHQFLKDISNCEYDIIRAGVNKLNRNSNNLCQKLGFLIESYTEKGVRYMANKNELLEKFSRLFISLYDNSRANVTLNKGGVLK